MRRARELLLGSLPLLVPLPVGIVPESVPAPRDADPVRVSAEDTSDGRDPTHAAPGVGSMPASIPAEPAQPEGDCWVVRQWYPTIDGRLYHCTEWSCEDGRTWTECVPV